TVGGQRDIGGNGEGETVESPCVRGPQRVEERHRAGRDVMQLDELVVTRVRVVVNLADDDGADARAGIARFGRGRPLRRELFFAGADDMAAKADSVGGGAEAEPVAVAGEVGGGIAGSEVNGISCRIEREAVERSGPSVELCFREHEIAARRNHRAGRDAELRRPTAIVAEEPTAEVDV